MTMLSCRRLVSALTLGMSVGTYTTVAAPEPPRPAAIAPAELARQLNQAFIDVAAKVIPAVVVISVAHRPDSHEFDLDESHPFLEMLPREFRQRLEEPRERRKRNRTKRGDSEDGGKPHEPVFDGEGSGVVIGKEGYIVTNRHVVEGAEKIKVHFQDGAEFEATVRGTDLQSDLAVIKIDPGSKPLTIARLGDSRAVRVGEFAIAIGAPLELDYSVTFGHISAKGRNRILDDPSMDQDFLQTDANINPGNSGGPLVNIDGEVIGINTLIRGIRTGIGFAIPANLVREVSTQLIADGHFTRAYLGVRIHGLRDSADYLDTITGVTNGVVVFAIPAGSPAAKSDLKAGDVIIAVDGRPVASPQELRNEIRGKQIGASVSLDVHRFGRTLKVAVRPEAWPTKEEETQPVVALRDEKPTNETARAFGLTVDKLTTELAEHFQVERSSGVIITEVERDSVAEERGLRPGDIITEVNQKPVTSVKQFNEALKKADTHKGVVLHFRSEGTSRFDVLKQKRR